MIALNKIVAFVVTTRPEQATVFYRDKLGFKFVQDDAFALVFDAHGTTLRVVKMKSFTPPGYTVLGWEVDAIDKAVVELGGRGIDFERYQGMVQDQMGIWNAPGGSKVAWFKDPDGNVLSVSQRPQS
jgi:catechol 2,3-dioxygenase-like lactoylglutathione lyase family enzyme